MKILRSLFWFLFLDLVEQVFGEDDDGAIGSADVLQDDLVDGFLGYVEDGLLPQRVPPLLLQKVQGLVQQRPENVVQVALH